MTAASILAFLALAATVAVCAAVRLRAERRGRAA